MRTTKRFNPKVLARFFREGRGTGQYETYIPWHRVSRGDPSSRGRSHLLMWKGRQRELLSDGEWDKTLFATMLPNLKDLQEQFPLSAEPCDHELTIYTTRAPQGKLPGTKAIADQLKIPHPTISGKDETVNWVPTTDLLLILETLNGTLELLAVSVKSSAQLTRSVRRSLAFEKAYWDARQVRWLLITPEQSDKRVALTLRCSKASDRRAL